MADIIERLGWVSVHGTQSDAIAVMADAAREIERLRQIEAAAKLYVKWAKAGENYPHDEDGCNAHDAILDAVKGGLG